MSQRAEAAKCCFIHGPVGDLLTSSQRRLSDTIDKLSTRENIIIF